MGAINRFVTLKASLSSAKSQGQNV